MASTFAAVAWEKFDGPAPPGRIPAASVGCDGKLFVFGGETDYRPDQYTVNRYLGDLWMFSPAAGAHAAGGRWTELFPEGAGGPAARVSGSLVCASGVLTLYGGIERVAPGKHQPLSDVWSFNIARRKWTLIQADSSRAGGPGILSAHTATLTDLDQDSMIVFGGYNANTGPSNKVWVYSLSKKTWTLKNPSGIAPAPRNFHTAVAVPASSTLKIWGGTTGPDVFSYDLRTNSWSTAGPAPEYASGRMGGYLGGKLFSFGGFKLIGGQVQYLNELSFQTDFNFWSRAAVYSENPDGRCYAAVSGFDGALWVYGGFRRPADTERLADVWRAKIVG